MKNSMQVDVVIPTYRPDEKFNKLIQRLQKQSYPVNHIYVMDTDTGEFPKKVEEMDNVTVFRLSPAEFDHGATRNKGIEMSDADIVVCMTQDAVPADAKLIEELIKPFGEREDIGTAYARQLPASDCDVVERYTRKFNYPDESRIKGKEDIVELGIKTFFCSNVCAAYRKNIYEKMGGFSRKTIFNEDMIYAGQMVLAGYQIAYRAEAKVIHSHNYSGKQQFHRNFDLAVSQTDHPEVFSYVKSESEGIRLVKDTTRYLVKQHLIGKIPGFIYKSGCKYIGYKLGRHYKELPMWLVKKCSMSKTYWK